MPQVNKSFRKFGSSIGIPDFSKPTTTKAFAASVAHGSFKPWTITRRACSDNDVVVDIKYSGICHSDIHHVREEWGKGKFPM